MGLFSAFKKLLDPAGPIGNWLSPSEVYKERLGLPIDAPHTMRVQLETSAAVEKALAPSRFVATDEAVNVPKNRVRILSAFIQERWSPVYATTDSMDMGEILRASQTQIGWKVTQEQRSAYCDCTHATFENEGGAFVHKACGRSRKHLSDEQFMEQVVRQQIQASDEFYNGLIETVPGNDPVIFEGELLRGEAVYETLPDGSRGKMLHDGIIRGTMITQGRREYRERTKGFAHWDAGFIEKRKAALAEEDSRPIRNVQRAMESVAGESLPTWRPVGVNFRRDRRSAV